MSDSVDLRSIKSTFFTVLWLITKIILFYRNCSKHRSTRREIYLF